MNKKLYNSPQRLVNGRKCLWLELRCLCLYPCMRRLISRYHKDERKKEWYYNSSLIFTSGLPISFSKSTPFFRLHFSHKAQNSFSIGFSI